MPPDTPRHTTKEVTARNTKSNPTFAMGLAAKLSKIA